MPTINLEYRNYSQTKLYFYSLRLWFLTLMVFYIQVLLGVFLPFGLGLDSCLSSKFFIVEIIRENLFISNLHASLSPSLLLFLYFYFFNNFVFPIYLSIILWGTGVISFIVIMVLVFSGYPLVFGSIGFLAIVSINTVLSLGLWIMRISVGFKGFYSRNSDKVRTPSWEDEHFIAWEQEYSRDNEYDMGGRFDWDNEALVKEKDYVVEYGSDEERKLDIIKRGKEAKVPWWIVINLDILEEWINIGYFNKRSNTMFRARYTIEKLLLFLGEVLSVYESSLIIKKETNNKVIKVEEVIKLGEKVLKFKKLLDSARRAQSKKISMVVIVKKRIGDIREIVELLTLLLKFLDEDTNFFSISFGKNFLPDYDSVRGGSCITKDGKPMTDARGEDSISREVIQPEEEDFEEGMDEDEDLIPKI